MVAIDEVLILNQASEALQAELAGRGFRVVEVRLSEFMKAGGAAKCLVLKLGEGALRRALRRALRPASRLVAT